MVRALTPGAMAQKELQSNNFDLLIESTQLDFHYAISATILGGHTWEQRLLLRGFGDLVYQSPAGGGLAATTTFRCVVVDDNTGQSPRALINAGAVFRGKDLVFSLLFAGEAYADRIILFAGKIFDVKTHASTTELLATNEFPNTDVLLPPRIVNVTDFPNAPAESLGKRIPVLYGTNWPPAPFLHTDTTSNGTYVVADHEIETLNDFFELGIVQGEERNLVRVKGETLSTRDVANGLITLTTPLTDILFGSTTPLNGKLPLGYALTLFVQREQSVDNAGNAIDGDPQTGAAINTNLTTQDGDGFGFLGIGGNFGTIPQGRTTLIATVRHKGNTAAATTVVARMVVRHIEQTGTVIRTLLTFENLRWTSTARTTELEVPNIALNDTDRIEVYIEGYNEGGLGGANDDWNVFEVTLDIGTYADSLLAPLWVNDGGIGRPDDASGTFTGVPNGTLRQFADVLHSALIRDVGVTAVDVTSFTDARTFYGNLFFRVGIGNGWFHTELNAREWIDGLLQQIGAILFDTPNGWKIVPFDETRTEEYTFDLDTVLLNAGVDPLAPLDPTQTTLRQDSEQLSTIHHAFEVEYSYSPLFQRFVSQERANENESTGITELQTLCAESFTRYGPNPPRVVQADALWNAQGAQFLLEHLVRYFAFKRQVVTFETSTQGLHLELGDFIIINHPDIADILRAQKFEVHRIVYRFVPVTSPDGANTLSFRISITASAPEFMLATTPPFEDTIFDDTAFVTDTC